MIEDLKNNAKIALDHLRKLSGRDFGYDREAVTWLSNHIEELRSRGAFDDPERYENLCSAFGSFLGECIIQTYGGTWVKNDGQWCVTFAKGNAAFPFSKLAKQIRNGSEDNVEGFFTTIPVLFLHVSGIILQKGQPATRDPSKTSGSEDPLPK